MLISPCDPPPCHLVTGILADGMTLTCRAVIVTTGTFLRGLMHTGEKKTEGGRVGESAAQRFVRMSGQTRPGTWPTKNRHAAATRTSNNRLLKIRKYNPATIARAVFVSE